MEQWQVRKGTVALFHDPILKACSMEQWKIQTGEICIIPAFNPRSSQESKGYSWKTVISFSVVMNIDSFMRDFMRQPCVDDRFCPTYLYVGFGITNNFWFDGLCRYKHEHSDLISALGRFKIRCWQCYNSVLPILTLGWLQDASSKHGHQNMSQLAEKGWLGSILKPFFFRQLSRRVLLRHSFLFSISTNPLQIPTERMQDLQINISDF